MSDLARSFADLTKLLKEREEALDEREKKVQRLQETLEKKHPNLGKPSDVLRLNIGGKYVDVLRRTLAQAEGSLLASMFSGRWDDSLEKDADGRFFLDQDEKVFIPLLNFLRDKQNETPVTGRAQLPVFDTNRERNCFETLCEYYGLTNFVYPTALFSFDTQRFSDSKNKNEIWGWEFVRECGVKCEIHSDELDTFWLKPVAIGGRRVISYTVVLGDCTLAQIGWYNERAAMANYTSTPNGQPQTEGVGYGRGSMALDCYRCGMLHNSEFELLGSEVVSLKSGTTIRTETAHKDGVKWFVDGKLVSTKKVSEYASYSEHHDMRKLGIPCISIKGNCTITNIELQF